MSEALNNGSRYTWIVPWLAFILALIAACSAAWTKSGALEQRVLNLEAARTASDMQQAAMRQSYEDGLSKVGGDVSYIRGRIDYLNSAVQDIRSRH